VNVIGHLLRDQSMVTRRALVQ